MVDDFRVPEEQTRRRTAKFTIPSPSMLHLRAGRAGISRYVPDMEEFWADAAAAYRAAIAAFADAGCTYLQLDDVAFAYLCDPKIRERLPQERRRPGQAAAHAMRRPSREALKDQPAGHDDHHAHLPRQLQERLGRRGRLRAGGRGDVLDAASTPSSWSSTPTRAGGFEPLRFVPKGKKVVLGLVSSKTPQLESKDVLQEKNRRRRRSTCRWRTCASRRSAASRARTTATRSRGRAVAQARARRARSRSEVWRLSGVRRAARGRRGCSRARAATPPTGISRASSTARSCARTARMRELLRSTLSARAHAGRVGDLHRRGRRSTSRRRRRRSSIPAAAAWRSRCRERRLLARGARALRRPGSGAGRRDLAGAGAGRGRSDRGRIRELPAVVDGARGARARARRCCTRACRATSPSTTTTATKPPRTKRSRRRRTSRASRSTARASRAIRWSRRPAPPSTTRRPTATTSTRARRACR